MKIIIDVITWGAAGQILTRHHDVSGFSATGKAVHYVDSKGRNHDLNVSDYHCFSYSEDNPPIIVEKDYPNV